MKILIAEDEAVSRKKLQRILEKWGYEVVVTTNGAEALRAFQDDHFSLVITDWMMPEMDGLELVKRIRAMNLPEYVYVIMLTAKSKKDDLIAGLEMGADEFVSKPFHQDELRARVNNGLRIIRLESSLSRRNAELHEINQRMKWDLEAAAKIQASLLPAASPNVEGITVSWRFKPCDELAGDIFNVFKLDENEIGLYILDVSGHGVPAALLAVSVSNMMSPILDQASLLKTYCDNAPGYQITSPAEVLNHLNNRFPLDMENGQYFTLLYGILNKKTRQFRYSSAGHPGIIYQPRQQRAEILKTPSLPVGFLENNHYEEYTLHLEKYDRIYLYSDGIPEAESQDNKLFGQERMMQILEENRSNTLEESVNALLTRVEEWATPSPLKDDATLLGIEITS